MHVRIIVLLIIALVCIGILLINEYIYKQQNARAEKQLNKNNKEIIFVNNASLDIKRANYKSVDFFKMRNAGDLEINEFQYIVYSNKTNYYLKKE